MKEKSIFIRLYTRLGELSPSSGCFRAIRILIHYALNGADRCCANCVNEYLTKLNGALFVAFQSDFLTFEECMHIQKIVEMACRHRFGSKDNALGVE